MKTNRERRNRPPRWRADRGNRPRSAALLLLSLTFVFEQPGVAGEGGGVRALTTGDAASRHPTWSPDGSRIAFESDRDGSWSLYLLEVATARVERLTRDRADDRYPAWSPDGERLAFVRIRTGGSDLHLLDLGTGEAAPLAAAAGDEAFPSWSPDGRAIAFTRQLDGSPSIFAVAVDAAKTAAVIASATPGIWPRWSPDGERLAFFSRRDTGGEHDEVYLLERRTGRLTRLTDRPGNDFCPAWSPDGDRLVMVSVEADGSRSLRVVDLAGGELARLAPGFLRVTEPAWSPDGRAIAYAARRDEEQTYQFSSSGWPAARTARRGKTARESIGKGPRRCGRLYCAPRSVVVVDRAMSRMKAKLPGWCIIPAHDR